MPGEPVYVYIYDLTKGLAQSISGPLLGKQLDGIWHTGIVVYGQEFFFGSTGIESSKPCGTILGQPEKKHLLGETEIPLDMFMDYLHDLGSSAFRGEMYHLLEHNCNTFSNEVSQFLTGHPIPDYVTNLPQEFLNTPLGAMLKPFIDAMSSPTGGHPIMPFEPTSPRLNPVVSSSTSANHRSAPSSASSNQKPACIKNCSNDKTRSENCVAFSELKETQRLFHDVKEGLSSALSIKDAALLNEIMDFLLIENPDWSLSPSHFSVIGRVLEEPSFTVDQKGAAAAMLQESLMHENTVMMLKYNSSGIFHNILSLFEQHETPVIDRLAKSICNIFAYKEGAQWLSEASMYIVVLNICRHCVLHTDKTLNTTGAALAFNLTKYMTSEDDLFDLGCALVELLQRDTSKTAAEYGIRALGRCMAANNEVAAVATVNGFTENSITDRHSELSELFHTILTPHLDKQQNKHD